jgi:O-antigen ligase
LKFYQVKYLSYFLFFIGLYFAGRYCINSLAIFVIVAIIGLFKEGIRPIKEFPKLLLLPIAFYIIHIISSLYSSNTPEALFDLEVKFSFLLLPIIFGLQKSIGNKEFINILRIYVHATSLSMIVLLAINIGRYLSHGRFLFYNDYSDMLHPSYLSMYLIFNILIIVFLFIKKQEKPIYLLLSSLISFATLFIAESKAGQLTALLIIIFIAFQLIPSKFRRLAIISSFVLVFVFGYIAKDTKRFSFFVNAMEHYSQIKAHPEKIKESTALRILAWSASIEVIKRNPILGVGNGDIKDELSKVYAERDYNKPLEMHMNSHNQYLETAVGQGLVGLAFLFLMFLVPLFIVQQNPLLVQGFILLALLSILVESMFNTQAGVIFIAFFYALLFSRTDAQSKVV